MVCAPALRVFTVQLAVLPPTATFPQPAMGCEPSSKVTLPTPLGFPDREATAAVKVSAEPYAPGLAPPARTSAVVVAAGPIVTVTGAEVLNSAMPNGTGGPWYWATTVCVPVDRELIEKVATSGFAPLRVALPFTAP